MARLLQARNRGEKIAIWGDFDADGVTATSVLWEGLGQFFAQESQLTYYVPNRLTESHGLNHAGIDRLRAWGTTLIVTCDTGSTNLAEIAYAKSLGIEIIVTDHHTLPGDRPNVLAIINPRYFAETHPLYHLSGVAVAYKLIEALYATLPDIAAEPVTHLLDLVAIGLIADLVALKGDCRYLAQMGIRQLQRQMNPQTVVHPGIKFLLEACRKTGDRPTDISFGIGPRINAVSRIHGDASFCIELLTSRDYSRCQTLAQQAEAANTRRKEIQNIVVQQAKNQAEKLDLSTTGVLILRDPQWQGGVLGLVANQIAQEFGRPTILLSYDREQDLWKGSARSVQGIDLYELVHSQAHLLHRFGGHPFAAGLSLKPENLELFQLGINQKARQYLGDRPAEVGGKITADLIVEVADLDKTLFQELKALEPCGMGNPVPKFLVQNCSLEITHFHKLKDKFNRKLNYYKVDFSLWDETGEVEGICWGLHPDDILQGNHLDVVVELDVVSVSPQEQKYVVRLLAIAPTSSTTEDLPTENLLDYRQQLPAKKINPKQVLIHEDCPLAWQDLQTNYQLALAHKKSLALTYQSPAIADPDTALKLLIGIAKYLVQTKKIVPLDQLKQKLNCGDRPLILGLKALENFGFQADIQDNLSIYTIPPTENKQAIATFQNAFLEEKFQQQYFCDVPLAVIQQTLNRL
jgi:single-stranded-DNA-specific exonuclease